MKRFVWAFLCLLATTTAAKAADVYLFYSANSDNLDELGINRKETAHIFDGAFGPAADELPFQVKFDDFYVAKYPDQSFVFILNSDFNCGQLGCNTVVYTRDQDGDLVEQDAKDPVLCKIYDTDKLLCAKGGYKPKVAPVKKKKILHFPSPKQPL